MRAAQRILLLLALLLASACDNTSRLPEFELTGSTMGTSYSIKLVAPPDALNKDRLREEIAATLERAENLASTYRENSELSVFNANTSTNWIPVSAELCDIVEQALQISRDTDGAFDITVGPLVNLWGFGPTGDAVQPPTADEISAALTRVGYAHLQTDCSVPALRKDRHDLYVDLSGWAKGYAVDRLALLLDEAALDDYLVEIGGELRALGNNANGMPWAIAIEKPTTDSRAPQTILRVTNTGVATSGDYRNYFEFDGAHYSHTIDARSGRPVSHALAAVTVLDRSAAFADGMATALLVLGPQAGPALAEKLGLAAYFLIRGATGLEVHKTTVFESMGIQ